MNILTKGKTLWWAAGVGLIVVAACDEGGEFCDAMCECEGCNDWQEESCEIEAAAYFDIADDYGCSEEADEAYQCALDKFDCDDNDWQLDANDCDNEAEDLVDCIEKESDLERGSPIYSIIGVFLPIPYPDDDDDGAGQCTCACTCSEGTTQTVCYGGSGCCAVACVPACTVYGGYVTHEETCI